MWAPCRYDGTGDIVIDGESICTMGLKHVRQAVEIIVQEPVLFIGTVSARDTTTNHPSCAPVRCGGLPGATAVTGGTFRAVRSGAVQH